MSNQIDFNVLLTNGEKRKCRTNVELMRVFYNLKRAFLEMNSKIDIIFKHKSIIFAQEKSNASRRLNSKKNDTTIWVEFYANELRLYISNKFQKLVQSFVETTKTEEHKYSSKELVGALGNKDDFDGKYYVDYLKDDTGEWFNITIHNNRYVNIVLDLIRRTNILTN